MVVKKIAILFSGTGSNLDKILEKVHNQTFSTCRVEVAVTICNKPNAQGIQKAKNYGLDTVLIDHKNFKDRESFDVKLVEVIKESGADLVVLAGFMRFLTPVFTKNVKAINLHPSILPLFKGGNAIEDSYHSNMKVGGISVHYVSEELDGGEIIAQRCFTKNDNMSLEEFTQNIHTLEYELLPETIIKLLDQ